MLILAISTSVHTSSNNEEVYLADVELRTGKHVLAKLIDTYPWYDKAIRRDLLAEHRRMRMRLERNPLKDVAAAHFFLPNQDGNIFDVDSHSRLIDSNQQQLPCFVVNHSRTKLLK